MKAVSLLSACWVLCSYPVLAQQRYTLDEVIGLVRGQSPLALQAETRKENRYWQYRLYQSNYRPKLWLNGDLPDYNRDFFLNRLDDGTIRFQEREQTTGTLNLGLQQPLSLTGGSLWVNSNLSRYNDYQFNIGQWSGTLMNVRLEQPLFSFNRLRWDRQTEPLYYEESKREFVEELENLSVKAVQAFFDVVQAQVALQVAELNRAANDTIHRTEQQRFELGTTTREKLLQAEVQGLRARQEVTQARMNLQNARLALRTLAGLPGQDDFTLLLPVDVKKITIDEETALYYARQNRAASLSFQRRKIEAARDVARARGERYRVNLVASYGLNNSATDFNQVYRDPLSQQRINVGFTVPVVDWGRNQASMRIAQANQKLTEYLVQQEERNLEREIITQVNQFKTISDQLEVSQRLREVADERYAVTRQRYLAGKADITAVVIAQQEKDAAIRGYLDALRTYWQLYYDLRRLTLYDFAENRLLYRPE
jgi:outer membrane protein TolC